MNVNLIHCTWSILHTEYKTLKNALKVYKISQSISQVYHIVQKLYTTYTTVSHWLNVMKL
jgi:hypothetical protein